MIGEKYIDRDLARNGTSWGDDAAPFVSGDRGIVRWAAYPLDETSDIYLGPQRDASSGGEYGLTGLGTYNFGSAHAAGFNMSMCDGSVRSIGYNISERVHRCLCNRADGTGVEMP